MTTASTAGGALAGSVLMWPPEGVGDFADLAWVIAEALGNRAGVRGLDVHQGEERLHARVQANDPEYVAAVAADHGWDVYAPDESYAATSGVLADVIVGVYWLAPTSQASREPD
jgi:hypothetical protein